MTTTPTPIPTPAPAPAVPPATPPTTTVGGLPTTPNTLPDGGRLFAPPLETAASPAPAAVPAAGTPPGASPAPAPEGQPAPGAAPTPPAYTLKAPAGKQYDAALVDTFTAAAVAAGLPADKAQAMLDTLEPAVNQRMNDQLLAARDRQIEQWEAQARKDARIGGDKFDENRALAKLALQRAIVATGRPALGEFLDDSGLGSHPDFLAVMHWFGEQIAEDRIAVGASAQPDGGDSWQQELRERYPLSAQAAPKPRTY